MVVSTGESERCAAAFPVPDGWSIKSSALKLRPEQWAMVAKAQSEDKVSIFHKVSMADMYAVLSKTEGASCVSQLAKDRVNSWSSKMFAVALPGVGAPVLFVPQTMSRSEAAAYGGMGIDHLLEGDPSSKEARNLVVMAPGGLTQVRMSQIAPLDGDEPPDFRADMLNLFHEYDSHRTVAQMYNAMSEVVWWPSMASGIAEWVRYCSLCMTKVHAKRRAGMGIVIRRRHRHITADHAILPSWLQECSGYQAVLVILDLGSGDIEMVPCKTMSAQETCAHIFNCWIRTRGLFLTFGSDHGSSFVASIVDHSPQALISE